jgi:predicted nucleotidyltransferase
MNTSLDVSRRLDQASVDLLLAVDSVAVDLGVSYCIIGAFARDVVLGLCFGVDTGEATRDIDFGLMMDDWAQFDELRARLIAHKDFAEHRSIPHRLTFRGVRQLDIMPFGGIERRPGEIAWPPEFTTVMSTVGLRQAHARALRITVAEGRSVPFASPAALALLKLIAWSERGSAVNRKDARDLSLLLTTYLRAGNEERLYGEHAALLDEADFDLEAAGARILGRDLAGMAGQEIRARLEEILDRGIDPAHGEPLLRDLPLKYEDARRMLEAFRSGLREAWALLPAG